jgi:16S rRNA C967 or C1407 C5-methylase (RsmB/RsmF family)
MPVFSGFHKWLVAETEAGAITRQEAVSMIPPFLMDVQGTHKVLDMCAAPGSKTSQILEMLHKGEMTTGVAPTGIVVANDSELNRAFMLVHQCKRIGSPALVVICHQAQHFPNMHTKKLNAMALEQGRPQIDPPSQSGCHQGMFDRILADVPCSGDGTMRKAPEIWRTWSARNGMALHTLQLQIAMRGCWLLKVGR